MPSARAFYLLILITTVIVTGVVVPTLREVALLADVALLGALVIDWRRARSLRFSAERVWPRMLFQDQEVEVEVELASENDNKAAILLREPLGPAFGRARVRRFAVAPRGTVNWRFSVRPQLRGEQPIGPLMVRVLGPWRLAWCQRELLAGERARVYPRVRWDGRVGDVLLLAHRRSLGQNPQSLRGFGGEPYSLRDYRSGDSPRLIQWRASARHGRLISREDTWERGAHLIVLLDCGRSMAARATDLGGLADRSKLDYALAAGLALCRVAAARGDRVTVVAFSDRIEAVVGINNSGSSMAAAYRQLYDLEARLVESSFDLAAEKAIELEGRRSIVLLMTSITDLAASTLLRQSLARLDRRHTAMVVNLLDPELRRMLEESPNSALEVFAKVAALDIVLANRELAFRLRRAGVRVVNPPADRLALETIETFLAGYSNRNHSSSLIRRRSA